MAESAPEPPPFPARSTVVTVGTFDGVHRGHLALLARLRQVAARQARPGVIITFEPHPLRVVRPAEAPPLLTTRREKIELLSVTGPDYTVFLRFDARLAAYGPRRFVEEVLLDRLGMAHLVIGYDHGFGRDRSGDADTLREIGAALHFEVEVVPPVLVDGDAVSSSGIRRALAGGDVVRAAHRLGRAYSFRGRVMPGNGRGRGLGFPTANLYPDDDDKMLPAEGIYAVRVLLAETARNGILHLGPRPTFPGAEPAVEVHLLDFEGDLYGCEMEVAFCQRLRAVEQFENATLLVRAMERDRQAARAVFDQGAAACGKGAAPLA